MKHCETGVDFVKWLLDLHCISGTWLWVITQDTDRVIKSVVERKILDDTLKCKKIN